VVLEEMSLNALSMPWTSRPPMTQKARAQVQNMLAQTYSPAVLDEFNACEKQNRWSKIRRLIFHAKNKVAKVRKMLRGGPQV
jgi:ribulose bisphosphate carboxylase small subunit